MSDLSASARAAVPQSQFGVPSRAGSPAAKKKSGNYPMPDANHARAALALLHNAPPAQQARIRAKAHAVLARKSGPKSLTEM